MLDPPTAETGTETEIRQDERSGKFVSRAPQREPICGGPWVIQMVSVSFVTYVTALCKLFAGGLPQDKVQISMNRRYGTIQYSETRRISLSVLQVSQSRTRNRPRGFTPVVTSPSRLNGSKKV